jgi:hypothetical protein
MIRRFEKRLGKLLFPRSERWRQQQKVRVVLVISLVQIAAIGMILYMCHHGASAGGGGKNPGFPGTASLFQ